MNLTPRARALRKNATRAEQHLWYEYLRLCQPKIRRQHVLAGFILDFYCIKLQLAIEQGRAHQHTPEGQARDATRTKILETHNVTVIRFENSVVLEELEAVIAVLEKLKTKPNSNNRFVSLPKSPIFGEVSRA